MSRIFPSIVPSWDRRDEDSGEDNGEISEQATGEDPDKEES
jgi:hypothetical protein